MVRTQSEHLLDNYYISNFNWRYTTNYKLITAIRLSKRNAFVTVPIYHNFITKKKGHLIKRIIK